MSAKNPVLLYFQHLLMAVIFILKGYDKFSHDHHVLGGIIFAFGIIVLLYFLYMVVLKKDNWIMHILVHLFEALASLITAYIFYEEGKGYIHYFFILAAIGFFIAIYVYIQRKRKGEIVKQEHH